MRTLKNKLYKNISRMAIACIVLLSGFMLYAPAPALAQSVADCENIADEGERAEACCNTDAKPATVTRDKDGKVTKRTPGNVAPQEEIKKCLANNSAIKLLNRVIRILSAMVGVVIVGGIIWGGIQYIKAGNSPNEIQKAKQQILNAVIALLFFIFLYALLEWLIPGGSGLNLVGN